MVAYARTNCVRAPCVVDGGVCESALEAERARLRAYRCAGAQVGSRRAGRRARRPAADLTARARDKGQRAAAGRRCAVQRTGAHTCRQCKPLAAS
eukprot:6182551-Pleurochrysis_carterae.AAC.1